MAHTVLGRKGIFLLIRADDFFERIFVEFLFIEQQGKEEIRVGGFFTFRVCSDDFTETVVDEDMVHPVVPEHCGGREMGEKAVEPAV